jgi:hypothetical protein
MIVDKLARGLRALFLRIRAGQRHYDENHRHLPSILSNTILYLHDVLHTENTTEKFTILAPHILLRQTLVTAAGTFNPLYTASTTHSVVKSCSTESPRRGLGWKRVRRGLGLLKEIEMRVWTF